MICRFYLAFILILFSGSATFVEAQKKYQGLLWEITGNGATKPSYLYGTMHVSNKIAFNLSDTFFSGLRSVDVVGLETNPESWMADMLSMDMMSGMQSYTYNNYQHKGFYEKAFRTPVPNRETLTQIFAEDKQLVNRMLFRTNSYSANYEENTYLDLFIFQSGKKLKKTVTHLEDFAESMNLYAKAIEPHKDDKRNNRPYDPSVNLNDMLQNSYRKGDLDLMDSLMTLMNPGKNYRKYFLDERNRSMARNIDSVMRRQTIFAAVGAAHLAGEEGVINLLRKKGYTVRAISMQTAKNSNKEKDKLEKLAYPLVYNTWVSPDSMFKVNVPGKLYEIPQYGKHKQYLLTEMVNGAYFSVIRVETYGLLNGKSQAYIEKSIDSLLYEKVPGKIIKREKIKSKNGYPGFNITSKTRRGDILRYNVFISPMEIFVFMMGGNGDFAKKESEKYFSGIQFTNSRQGWKTYAPKHGGYQVNMPANIIFDDPRLKTSFAFNNESVKAYSPADSGFYMLMKSSLYDFNYIEEDTFELNQLADNFISQYKFKEESRKHGVYNNHPSLDVKLKSSDGASLFVRCIIKGANYYLLAARNRSGAQPKEFFDSFRFTDYNYKEPFVDHVDSAVYGKVLLTEKPSQMNNRLNSRKKYNLYGDKDEDRSYLYDSHEKVYTSKSTAESVFLKYTKFHKYASYKDADDLWKHYTKELARENSLIVHSQKSGMADSFPTLDLVLTDTGSIRAVKIKLLLKHGALYTLKSITDTLNSEPRWTSQFFSSFRPADTIIGESVFIDKSQLFLSSLTGADTVLKKQALNSLFYIDLKDNNATSLANYINSSDFSKQTLDKRAQLIRILGRAKNTKNIALLKNVYDKISDTVTLQLAILEAIANHKSPQSAKAILELLNKETPLTSDVNAIGKVFRPLYDSLPLAKNLYPDFLAFNSYPEYKTIVYDLLARLADSGHITKNTYATNKQRILKEANEELKRQFAREEKLNKSTYNGNDYENSGFDYDYDYEEDYNYENDYSGRFRYNHKVLSYTTLLAPYYNEAPVKAYFDKLARLQDKKLKLDVSVFMLRKNIPVADSIWISFASDMRWRIAAYNSLNEINKLSRFDTAYSHQLDIAKAGLYSYSSKAGKDSIVYIGEREVYNKYGKTLVYFFKSKKDKAQNWQIDYIAFRAPENGNISTRQSLKRMNKTVIIRNDDVEKAIKEAVKETASLGRKRVSNSKNNYDALDYNYFDE